MGKNTYIIIGAGIIVIISGWLVLSNNFWQGQDNKISAPEIINSDLTLVIDSGEGEPNSTTTEFVEGMTAFDLLKNKAEELDIPLKIKTYDIGILIEAIADKVGGQDNKYWMYYVNGVQPMVSADKMEVKPGDKVEFKFEKSNF